MLKLFFGLFEGSATASVQPPRSPGGRTAAIRLALGASAWVPLCPTTRTPAARGPRRPRARRRQVAGSTNSSPARPRRGRAYRRVRRRRGARAERCAGVTGSSWLAEEMTSISCSAARPSPDDPARAHGALWSPWARRSARRACPRARSPRSLAPVSRDDLVRAVGVEPAELEALEQAPRTRLRRLVVTEATGEPTGSETTRARPVGRVRSRRGHRGRSIVDRGLSRRCVRARRPRASRRVAPYLVGVPRRSVTRRGAGDDRLHGSCLAGVAQGLDGHARRPSWDSLADVQRARRAATDALLQACRFGTESDPGASAERGRSCVRCRLVCARG